MVHKQEGQSLLKQEQYTEEEEDGYRLSRTDRNPASQQQSPETMADTVWTSQGSAPELRFPGEETPATSLSTNVNGYQQ